MKLTATTPLIVLVAAATLTGCSAGVDAAPQPTVTVTVTQTVTATPEPAAAAPTPTEATASDTPKAEPTETSTPSGPRKSARGNLIKDINEEAGLISPEGEDLALFKVTGIDPNFQCNRTPENGKFVAITIEAETMAALADQEWPQIEFEDWIVVGADGKQQNADPRTIEAMMCVEDSEQFPPRMGPGLSAEGVMVLDVTPESGVAVLRMDGGFVGWEWNY